MDGECEARNRKLYRYVVEAIRRVDEGVGKATSVRDLFTSTLEIQRQKIRDNCERLMFADPLAYGRKAQDLLWRKGHYETVSAAKRLRAGGSCGHDALVSDHLHCGIGQYHRILSQLRAETDETDLEWRKTMTQTCLVYLGDLSRYKTEFDDDDSDDSLTAERYYLQAVAVDPGNGTPHNQLATLSTGRNHNLDSVRHYIACLCCPRPFEGAEGNLTRILDKNSKHLDSSEPIKNFVAAFLTLVECWYFDKNHSDFNHLCTTVLFQLNERLTESSFYSADLSSSGDRLSSFLTSDVLHRIVLITLFNLNKFVKEKSKKTLPMKAFALALLSRLLQSTISDLMAIGFQVQSPNEIVEERKETSLYYQNLKNQKSDVQLPPLKEIEIEIENKNEINNQLSAQTENSNTENKSEEDLIIDTAADKIIEEIEDADKEIESYAKNNKHKGKKVSVQKMRRRRRRLNSLDSSDESETEHCSENESSDEKSEPESESEASEASYLTYTSSEEDESRDEGEDDPKESGGRNTAEQTENGLNKTSTEEDKNNTIDEENKIEDKNKFSKSRFDEFLENNNCLVGIHMLLTWLYGEEDFLISCKTTGHALFQDLINILNIVNRQIFPRVVKTTYNVSRQYDESLYEFHKIVIAHRNKYKSVPLNEDFDVRPLELCEHGLRKIRWSSHNSELSKKEITALRLLRTVEFGLFISKPAFGIFFNRRMKMYAFKRTRLVNKRNPMVTKKYNIRDLKMTTSKNKSSGHNAGLPSEGLMRNLGKLWLSAQVQELESKVRAGKQQPVLPAYIVVDAEALSKFTYLVKRLVSSKKVIVLIPTVVLQLMDEMKKESGGARSAIRWLEFQLRNGSRFLRTQRESESSSVPFIKYPKKMNKDMQNYVQIIEFCHYFVSQGINDFKPNDSSGDTDSKENRSQTDPADNSNVLVLLTDTKQWENSEQSDFSYSGIANSAGITVENIQTFCVKMKALFLKGAKIR